MIKIISFIGWCIITVIGKTLRIAEVNSRDWWKKRPGQNVVFAFWHGDQFLPCYHHRGQQAAIMSSQSRDGEIQAGILRRFGYVTVRGSSTRGAEKALVETIRLVKKGHSGAFAVDGPRGPFHEIKPGIVYLAQKTGKVIIPVTACPQKYGVLKKAWDKYKLPRPFTKGVIVYGEPVEVRKEDSIEERTCFLQNCMKQMSEFSEKYYWSKDVREYLEHHPRPKILVVQPSRIGDVVFTLPAVLALRKKYPAAWIGWLVDERCAPVLEGNPAVDEIIVFDRRKVSLSYLFEFRRKLREMRIDLSIDFHGLFKSAFAVLLAGAKFRLASASTNGMRELSWLVSKEIRPPKKDTHCVDRHLQVARYLGCPAERPEFNVAVSPKDTAAVEELLKKHGIGGSRPLVAVHPGGGWIARRWFPERFSELIRRLHDEAGADVVLVGGKEGGTSEKGLNEEIAAAANGGVTDLTGATNLKELAALLSKCAVFVANEAGPMHLAVGLDVKTVALIGPTDPGRTGPYRNTRILRHRVDCQPCRNRSCATRECMRQITVDEVFSAVNEMLQGK
jgi:heptosyltransferase-1